MSLERDSRTIKLLGKEKVKKLNSSYVTICGLGGVGSYVAEALARTSIGNITIVDFDRVDESNMNRQLYALSSTIGLFKADVAEKRIKDINPDCNVIVRKVFLDDETIPEILSMKTDCIIDAIDTIKSKVDLLESSFKKEIYTVASMGAAERLNTENIEVCDISKTYSCSLARVIRTRLRKKGINKGIKCVFSPEKKEIPLSDKKYENEIKGLGSISYIPAIFGMKIAGEVINYLVER
ncbi:MAG: tRNA threonylcarbamoyladenosine dehydratase [Desulfobacterales bacterium]|nr:tRNA threonylcarbamoyladenosine dehydratase [Desulfobacterales bacterium]